MQATLTIGGIATNAATVPDCYVEKRANGFVLHRGRTSKTDPVGSLPVTHIKAVDDNGAVLLDGDIPGLWWNARIYFRRDPVTIKFSPADLVARNRMFAYGNTGCEIRPVSDYVLQNAMDAAGITKYMPQTGERADIGLITDPSARYMLGGSPGSMIAWAMAAAGVPVKYRDDATGRPIDLIQNPSANAADLPGLQGGPFLLKGRPDPQAPQYSQYDGGWNPQQAHYPELSYLAYCATQDEGFLEDLQYSANFTVLCDAYFSHQRNIATVKGERRGLAWALRNLFMAHIATKDHEALCVSKGISFPTYLQPSSYWKKLLDQALAFYAPMMADPISQAFGIVPAESRYSPWMQDYLCLSLAFGVLTGHADWNDFYLFNLKNVINRTSGKTGWPPAYSTPYRSNTVPSGDNPAPGAKPFTWAESFADLQTDFEVNLPAANYGKLVKDPLNGGVTEPTADGGYVMTTRAVIVMADYLDKKKLAPVRATYLTDFDLSLANAERFFRSGGVVNARVSVVADASGVPTTIPPLPEPAPDPTPQPATGVTLMPSTLALKIGESHQLNLTVTPTGADLTGLVYRAVPDGVVTLAANAAGVAVTRNKAGNVQIFADLNGHEAEADASYTPPLAESLVLAWA